MIGIGGTCAVTEAMPASSNATRNDKNRVMVRLQLIWEPGDWCQGQIVLVVCGQRRSRQALQRDARRNVLQSLRQTGKCVFTGRGGETEPASLIAGILSQNRVRSSHDDLGVRAEKVSR